jgi:hypothetical protein
MIPESVVIFTLMLLSFTELRLAAVRLTSTGLVFWVVFLTWAVTLKQARLNMASKIVFAFIVWFKWFKFE